MPKGENTMSRNTLVLIDSNKETLSRTDSFLRSEGYDVISTSGADKLAELFEKNKADAVVLSDAEIQPIVRSFTDVPVIIYTESSSIDDKARAYENGCDDYLVRPCDVRELVLRVNACIKRSLKVNDMLLEFPPLSLNIRTREVFLSGKFVKLTNREFEILALLAETPNKTISIKEIYSVVWGEDTPCDNHLVMVNVSYIRKKFDKILPDVNFINTRWGIGYSFAYPPVKSK